MSAADLSTASFSGAIRQTAADMGHAITPAQVSSIEAVCQSLATLDPETGTVVIDLGKGPVAIDRHLASEVGRLPRVASPSGHPTTPTTHWAPRHVNDGFAAMSRGWAEQQRNKLAQEIATWPNPWIAGANFNRTRQTVIQNANPALAAQMKANA